jgi:ribosomal protein S18 acetylase RimI-like enzyme
VELTDAIRRCWPAASETSTSGGWLVRETPGVRRRRSNCAIALDARPDLDAVPSDVVQVGLGDAVDDALARRGWTAESDTDVLVAPRRARTMPASVREVDRASWAPTWAALEQREDGAATEHEVLARIEPDVRYLLIDDVAAAMVVVDPPWAGVFCVVVRADHRRRGLARALLAAAHATPAAEQLHLSVERGNLAAQELYRAAGFAPALAYRYRRRTG